MLRHLFFVVLLLILGWAVVTPVSAQYYDDGDFSENLSQLSVSERARVIEDEYAAQSGGRRIPDDQMDIYLDRIRSGWTFSRIRQDIATSLSSRRYSNYSGYGGYSETTSSQPQSITCSSEDNRYRECLLPFTGRARLVEQLSHTSCYGNWGQRSGMVWVNQGCRARFDADPAQSRNPGESRVSCESTDNRYRECRNDFTGSARLYRQTSKARCVEGQTWGQRPGVVWVSGGCRAEFVGVDGSTSNYGYRGGSSGSDSNPYSSYRNGGYSVTCESQDNRPGVCAWNTHYGTPRLLKQQSKAPCVSGSTWGYDNRGIWVSNGCRARFGP